MNRQQRYDNILDHFRTTQPVVTTELEFGSGFQLLVATMLSAQCTDKRVNEVTPELFRHYPDAASMAEAEPEDILGYIRSVSYPNAKAGHLAATARMIVSDFGGEVPDNMDDLTRLPGVGRKTANVMLAVFFGQPNMPVDTHVFRVSHRLGLVSPKADTPLKVEQELLRHIPDEDMANAHHWLLLHGRRICQSRKPKCGECPFASFCPSNGKTADGKG